MSCYALAPLHVRDSCSRISCCCCCCFFFRATNIRGIMKNLSLLISSPVVVLIDECIFENSYNVFLTFTDLYFLYSTDDKLIRKNSISTKNFLVYTCYLVSCQIISLQKRSIYREVPRKSRECVAKTEYLPNSCYIFFLWTEILSTYFIQIIIINFFRFH